ncbi:MAG: ATP synthase F1 subunit gamma [Flavobacteriales bacterium]|nr:ATP synthase F1 subunit gamma [Flavobacteriales bacterium]
MANLKEIRSRITSVASTMQITSAMKMVSAAKLKRAQNAIVQMRPYAEKLQEILANVSSSLDASEGLYSVQRDVKNVLVVAITSNRGLCGAFNSSIIKEVNRLTEDHKDANVKVLSLGKKAADLLKKDERYFTDGFGDEPYTIQNELTFADVSEVAQKLMDQFADGDWDKVIIAYNRFKNAGVQLVTVEQFLPVLPPSGDNQSNLDYIFEPSKEFIVEEIIPKSLKVQLYKSLLDSRAAEHGARMTAMHKATENASDLKSDLTLHYNKARQAAITGEILEIVGGAEALNG